MPGDNLCRTRRRIRGIRRNRDPHDAVAILRCCMGAGAARKRLGQPTREAASGSPAADPARAIGRLDRLMSPLPA